MISIAAGLLYYIVISFAAFFIPGFFFVRNLEISAAPRVIHSYILGFVLFALQGYVSGLLDIRWFGYVYVSVFFLLFIWQYKKFFRLIRDIKKIRLQKRKFIIILLIAGFIAQLISASPMGYRTEKGLHFCCGLPDSLYHIALTYELVQNVPPSEPGMAGVAVKNYYYLSNMINADLTRLFGLPLIRTQTDYSHMLFSLLFVMSAYSAVRRITGDRMLQYWVLFFMFFQSDLVGLFLALFGRGIDPDVRGMHDATRIWFSPPRMLSVIMASAALDLLFLWRKSRSHLLTLILIILIGSLIGFKIYTSLFMLIGLSGYALYSVYRKDYGILPLYAGTLLLTSLIYISVTSGTKGSLEFNGLWRMEDFFADPTTINFVRVESARLKFLAARNYIPVVLIELFYFAGFSVLSFGTQILAFFQNRKSLKLYPAHVHAFLIPGILISIIIGYFFIQNPGHANTTQFIITAQLFLPFYAGTAVYYILNKKSGYVRNASIALILMLTLWKPVLLTARSIYNVMSTKTYFLTNGHLAAAEFLRTKTHPESIILVDRFMTLENLDYQFRFLSERRFYLLGKNILSDHGADISQREALVSSLESPTGHAGIYKKLKSASVTHIWTRNDIPMISKQFLKKYTSPVFSNNKITIYRVL